MKKVIGIIGGNGKMGRCFAAFFEDYGFDVLIADKGTKLTNKKIVQKSDIVFVSVSISHFKKVLNEIVPLLKKGQTLIEINSIKDNIIPILKKAECEVLSLHPMCNETQLTAGAKILFMPVKGKSAAKIFKNLFKEAKFNLQEIKIEQHDKLMALIQGLPHFAEISFAHTMKDLGFKTKELMKYASPATDLKLKMVGRILAQSPELYGSMQIDNLRNKKIIKAHLESVSELYEIVKQGDLKAFEKYFSSAAQFLGKYKDEALSETDHVISTLRQEDLFGEVIRPIIPSIKPLKNIASKNIALLGPAMTYTDVAADLFLKKSETKKSNFTKQITNKIFKSTIEDVISEVANGQSKLGMLPIENRLHGTVRETLDGFFTYNVQMIDLISLPINHCLAVLPGVKPKDIKIVMSHNQALSQCKLYLQKSLKSADLVSVSSSAKAFENVKSKNFRHIAVIGPVQSAKHHGFKVLKENIADDTDNVTKFAVITKAKKETSILDDKNPLLKNPKNSSIAFYFSSDKAGSLFTVFEAFAKNKVNMTRVESRPYKKDFGNYLFFIDFEGNPSDKMVKDTLNTVNSLTAGLKLLGTY